MPAELKPKLDSLGDILAEQIEAHTLLTGKAIELRDALVDCDHDAIRRLTLENEKAASTVRRLENKRIEMLRKTGLAPEDTSFSAIEKALADTELTPEEAASLDKLRNLRKELATVIHELDHHNQLNITLIGQALDFQQLSMRLILNAITGESTGYTREGGTRNEEAMGLFDGFA
jgi:hypothetical protein